MSLDKKNMKAESESLYNNLQVSEHGQFWYKQDFSFQFVYLTGSFVSSEIYVHKLNHNLLWNWPLSKPDIRFNAEFILKKVLLRPSHYNYYADTFTSILSIHIRNTSKSKLIYIWFLLWYSIFLYWVLKLKPNHICCFISHQRNLMLHNICPVLFSEIGK